MGLIDRWADWAEGVDELDEFHATAISLVFAVCALFMFGAGYAEGGLLTGLVWVVGVVGGIVALIVGIWVLFVGSHWVIFELPLKLRALTRGDDDA